MRSKHLPAFLSQGHDIKYLNIDDDALWTRSADHGTLWHGLGPCCNLVALYVSCQHPPGDSWAFRASDKNQAFLEPLLWGSIYQPARGEVVIAAFCHLLILLLRSTELSWVQSSFISARCHGAVSPSLKELDLWGGRTGEQNTEWTEASASSEVLLCSLLWLPCCHF